LCNGSDKLITLPLKKDSDTLNIVEREISNDWIKERKKLLNIIKELYKKAPFFEDSFQLIEKCLLNTEINLFKFIYDSIILINNYIGINTKMIISSDVDINHKNLKSQEKVLAICKERNGDIYINAIGGIELYNKEDFQKNQIILNFIKSEFISYKQFSENFIPWLSIIDVMMFNSVDQIKNYINQYTLI
jgi:hypothetical protein